ncbi:MAG: 50S ribosomal protein L29 [Anaerolineae bacterium]|nr:50S ribosomal protein L29 [Anaerolineae bacterium]
MKLSEIRIMTNEQLATKLDDTRQELMNLRFQFVTGQLTDTSRLPKVRRSIAQLETVLRERELAGQEESKE